MSEINVYIDGKEITANSDMTIFEAAASANIYIPSICTHPDLAPSGECGLCLVDIEGESESAISCNTKAADKMVVHTGTDELRQKQHRALEKILSEHPCACLTCWRKERCKPFDICLRNVEVMERCVTCPENGRCELQRVVDFLDVKSEDIPYTYRNLGVNRDNPFFELDYNLCIACGRCVRACQDLRGIKALDFIELDGYKVAGPVKGTHNESGCKYCFTCVEVCPTGALVDKEARYRDVPDWDAYVVPCREACPAHIDIPRYVYLAAQGKYSESLAVVREKVPFPGALGRVCIHPCEQACRRGELNKEEPVCIKFLKRAAADYDNGLWKKNSTALPATGKKVAVVGSGPAGLTAAFYLAKKGHSVTVFEALSKTGGMMRVGIPSYRLPEDILDSEIKEIENVGVEIKTNSRINDVDELLKQGYEAVFLGLGAHLGTKAGVKGDDTAGVMDGVDFLRQVSLGENVKIGEKIAVIGGGNAAIDCARTAPRIGAKEVTIIYRRTRAEMPAAPEEVEEALHEGVEILFLAAPTEIRLGRNGRLELECTKMELGEPDASGRRRPVPIKGSEFITEFDNIISSIGQAIDIPEKYTVDLGRGNVIKVDDDTMATSQKGVFAGGDVVTGPASVIQAIAQGRKAAASIDKYLGGDGDIEETLVTVEKPDKCFGRDEDFINWHKVNMPSIENKERLSSFAEVELGYGKDGAVEEAKRCLKCDLRLEIKPSILPPIKVKSA
jgi:NADPH-dependent glutamate synthase beta subunit-like oxidoreductase/formate hydrogenlyase subunit 6/NADH:ubiquinone oxidoreductase subunit I